MAKNIDVVQAFMNGEDRPKTKNLRIENNKLVNYGTVIAERSNNLDRFVVNVTKYSQSTTTIQNMLLREIDNLPSKSVRKIYKDNVEMGTDRLY